MELVFADLDVHQAKGMAWPDDGWWGIALDHKLGQQARNEVLTHELVHVDRGGGSTHPDPIVRRREERRVDEEVARLLVPLDDLLVWLRSSYEPVTTADVAEEWDVSHEVAAIALGLLPME